MIEKKFYSNRDLFKNGESTGFIKTADGSLLLSASKGKALFFSHIICAKEKDTLWSHIHLSINQYRTFQVFVMIDNDKEKLLTVKEEQEFIEGAVLSGNQKDILLFDKGEERGKYLRFLLRCYALKEDDIYFYGYNVTYMEQDITQEMAHPFHENYDLMKYLSVYQQGYFVIKKKQEEFIAKLNLKVCDYNTLLQLASWLGVDKAEKLEASVLRNLLIHNSYLQEYKGCWCYYQKLANILWEEEVIIREVDKVVLIIAREKEDEKIKVFKDIMNNHFPPFITIRYLFLSEMSQGESVLLEINSVLQSGTLKIEERSLL